MRQGTSRFSPGVAGDRPADSCDPPTDQQPVGAPEYRAEDHPEDLPHPQEDPAGGGSANDDGDPCDDVLTVGRPEGRNPVHEPTVAGPTDIRDQMVRMAATSCNQMVDWPVLVRRTAESAIDSARVPSGVSMAIRFALAVGPEHLPAIIKRFDAYDDHAVTILSFDGEDSCVAGGRSSFTTAGPPSGRGVVRGGGPRPGSGDHAPVCADGCPRCHGA